MTSEPLGRFLPPGTKVRYDGLVDGGSEYGVVIYCWIDAEANVYDGHIAFYGAAFPEGAPKKQPYVLRYASTSLVVVD
ncbi:MAG: hypothetical protein H7124_05965 [Phycisphaerales bacterium]|nr:hypothetical protein [Hyphomonadaceae bacterium]